MKKLWLIRDEATGAIKGVLGTRDEEGKPHLVYSEECCCGESTGSTGSTGSEESTGSTGSTGTTGITSGSSGGSASEDMSTEEPFSAGRYCIGTAIYFGPKDENPNASCADVQLDQKTCQYIGDEEAWNTLYAQFGVCQDNSTEFDWSFTMLLLFGGPYASSGECSTQCQL